MDTTHPETDLHSFIQSGMGIALPALSMDPGHPEEESFEVGHFGELMRDGAGKDADSEDRGEKRVMEDEADEQAGKRPRQGESQQRVTGDDAVSLPGATTRPETVEERKARQREANRLAAGRSRGKKRDELAILEKTVQNIQEENNRLRTQLEALVTAAQQPHAPSPPAAPAPAHEPMPHHEPDTQSILVAGQSLDIPLGLEIDGTDLAPLVALQQQLTAARRDVAHAEARLHHQHQQGDAFPLAEEKTRAAALAEQRAALVAVISSLKRDREAVDVERATLERELLARRALLAGTAEGEEAGEKEPPAAAEGGKKHVGGEPGRDVGVERALMDVRRWLDDALTSWQRTGVLHPPTSSTDGLPNPPPAEAVHGLLHHTLEEPPHVEHDAYELDSFHSAQHPGLHATSHEVAEHGVEHAEHGAHDGERLLDEHGEGMLEDLEGEMW